MSSFEVISFVASVASLILAVVAIWLSIVFFRMSSDALKGTTEAAKGIGASVERLEKLFDKLYADTFSMMRDTVSDMRKHIWPIEESEPDRAIEDVEKKADAKIKELKETTEGQLSQILQQQSTADGKVSALQTDIRRLIDKVIMSSRQVETEAREETIREQVVRGLRVLREQLHTTTASALLTLLRGSVPFNRLIDELKRMETEGLISLSDEHIGPGTVISLGTPFLRTRTLDKIKRFPEASGGKLK